MFGRCHPSRTVTKDPCGHWREELFRQKEQLQAGIGLLGNNKESEVGVGHSSKSRGWGVDKASGKTGVRWAGGGSGEGSNTGCCV